MSSSILSDLHASTYLIFIRFLRGRYNFHPHRRGKRGGDGDIKSNWECPESNPRLQALEPMLLAIALYCFSTGVQVRHLLLSLYFEFLIDDYVSLKKKKKSQYQTIKELLVGKENEYSQVLHRPIKWSLKHPPIALPSPSPIPLSQLLI